MRVLHIVTLVDDRASYGGPLTVAINHCRELNRRGHRASIVGGWRGRGEPPETLEGVPAKLFPVRAIPGSPRFSGLYSRELFRWIGRHAPSIDLAHVHLARDIIPLLSADIIRRAGTPFVVQTHGMITPDGRITAKAVDAALTRRTLLRAAAVLTLTDKESGQLEQVVGTDVRQERLPNGVARVAVGEPPEHGPEQLLDVLFMARLHPRKRVLTFAAAAIDLLDERIRATFSVVGPDDGDLEALHALVGARPDVGHRIKYEGALDHQRAIERLSVADVYVLPSLDEPYPMSLLEALSRGIPSVCTDSCGLADDLRSDEAALVVDSSTEMLKDAIRDLVRQVPLRRKLARNAVAAVDRRYSMEIVGNELVELYATCLGGERRRPARH